jgi:hypothetical protein
MSASEQILLILLALSVSASAVELVRREVIAFAASDRWTPVDAHATGALLAVVGAVVLWVKLALDDRHDAYSTVATLGVFLL